MYRAKQKGMQSDELLRDKSVRGHVQTIHAGNMSFDYIPYLILGQTGLMFLWRNKKNISYFGFEKTKQEKKNILSRALYLSGYLSFLSYNYLLSELWNLQDNAEIRTVPSCLTWHSLASFYGIPRI